MHACSARCSWHRPQPPTSASVSPTTIRRRSPEVAARFYDAMKDVGLTENRITLLWDSAHPTTIDGQDQPRRSDPGRAGRRRPRHARHLSGRARKALTESPVAPGKFAAFAALVARTFPTVKDFIVGNEPNKSRFWQPQFNRNGTRAACVGVRARARCVLRRAEVGRPLDHRGRRRSRPARDGQPVRPREPLDLRRVRCIADIGRAYRRSKRTKPIMDALSYHPYPNASTDKLDTGYAWPNAGIPDLARIKQAVWDAFHGTGQPTFEEAGMPNGPARTLKLRLNEVGWQVSIPPANRAAVLRQGERRHDRRGDAGGDLREPDPAHGLRPVRRVGALLQPRRRGEPRPLAVRADARGLDPAPVVRDRQGRDRRAARRAARAGGSRGVTTTGPSASISASWAARGARSERNKFWSFVAGSEEGTRYTAGLYRVRRPGEVAPTLRALISRSLRTVRMRGAVLRSRGKLVGGGTR